MAYFRAFSRVDWSRSALAELRCTTCRFEAVLFTLFHSGVAGQEAGLLTRDPRMKERKKYGLKAARRAPQFSKR